MNGLRLIDVSIASMGNIVKPIKSYRLTHRALCQSCPASARSICPPLLKARNKEAPGGERMAVGSCNAQVASPWAALPLIACRKARGSGPAPLCCDANGGVAKEVVPLCGKSACLPENE